jgi:hypothetical protein
VARAARRETTRIRLQSPFPTARDYPSSERAPSPDRSAAPAPAAGSAVRAPTSRGSTHAVSSPPSYGRSAAGGPGFVRPPRFGIPSRGSPGPHSGPAFGVSLGRSGEPRRCRRLAVGDYSFFFPDATNAVLALAPCFCGRVRAGDVGFGACLPWAMWFFFLCRFVLNKICGMDVDRARGVENVTAFGGFPSQCDRLLLE